MIEISDTEFEKLVAEGIDAIPRDFYENIDNLAFVIRDFPTREQLAQVKARPGTTLFGLYEGIPKIRRGNAYSGVLPDKITIFKIPLLCVADSREELRRQVMHTVWHEIAHHFGLDHNRIHELENKASDDSLPNAG